MTKKINIKSLNPIIFKSAKKNKRNNALQIFFPLSFVKIKEK